MNNNILFRFIFLLCLVLSQVTIHGQNLSLAWSKEFTNPQVPLGGGLIGRAVKMNPSGDVYVVGNFTNTADFDPGPGVANLTAEGSAYNAFIAKYDANGNYIFAKRLGGNNAALPFSLAIDASGYLYLGGTFAGTVDFDPGPGVINFTSAGFEDMFIAKYDADGNYVFAKTMGGTDYDHVSTIMLDGNGGVYITGYFGTTVDFDPGPGVANVVATGTFDIYLAKYDVNGNYIFAKGMGGSGADDEGNGIALDAGGNIYITGLFQQTVDFDPGPGVTNLVSAGQKDIFLAKYDAAGNYVFARRIGSTGSESSYELVIDGSGNLYMTGEFDFTVDFDPGPGAANLTSAGSSDFFIAKYDANGNYILAKGMGGIGGDMGEQIALDGSGNMYVLGTFAITADFDPGPGVANLTAVAGANQDVFFAKYDANGNYVFAKQIGGPINEVGLGLIVDGSGNLFITGGITNTVDFDPGPGVANLTSPGTAQNGFIAGYTNNGDYRFAGLIGGYNAALLPDAGYDVALDVSGNVYITGSFIGTVDFDPGPGVVNLTSSAPNTADIFIAKYDAAGNYLYAKQMGGISADNAYSLFVDAAGNVYITGTFTGTADFDPGPGVVNLVSAGGTDIFFAKYDAGGNYVYAKNVGGTSSDNGASLSVDASGNLYLAGSYQGTADFNPGAGVNNLVSAGGDDIFFAKYDASGNYVYAKTAGGTGSDNGNSIKVDGSGNVYVTGSFSGTVDFNPGAGVNNLVSAGGRDIFIAKYDASGNYSYAKGMGGTTDEAGNNIAVNSGNVYVTGYFTGTADLDPGAGVVNLVSAGSSDIFAAKYDASGNYVYAKSFGGSGNDVGNKILVDAGSNINVAGFYSNTVDFDPGVGITNLVSAGSTDIFIAKYNTTGNYIYAKSMGGTTADNGSGLSSDAGGNIYMTGNFTGTADFDPNAGTQTQSAWNSSDIYLVKLTECLSPEVSLSSATAALTTISGATLMTDGGCVLLASILPNGVNPVSGTLNGRNWVENLVPTFGGEPFVARHFELTPTSNPSSSTARVTLYFTQQEFDNFNAHPASTLDLPINAVDAAGISNLRIGKYSGTSNNGTGLPGSYAGPATILDPNDADIIWNSTKNRWEVSFDVDGFSGFIVQTSPVALPVTLLEFKGRLFNNNALLNWKTTNEQNAAKTIIERSLDGRNYAAIGSVTAYNTAGTHQYNFTDMKVDLLSKDILYYRLKFVDIDERCSYSDVVILSVSNKDVTLLYPNPVEDKLNLLITTGRAEKLRLTIMDNMGRVMMQKDFAKTIGNITTQWDVRNLATGTYFLRIQGESIHQNIRFVKQ